jgi:hypothetical protein
MNTKPTPHDYRRDSVTFWIGLPALIIIIAFIVMACSCRTPRYGCPNMADLKAHKHDNRYAWTKYSESGLVTVMDKQTGKYVCSYFDK